MSKIPSLNLSNDDFDLYLHSGFWKTSADDMITGETVPATFVENIVRSYRDDPNSPAAVEGLGLLSLMLGVAEWGVDGTDLPEDPAGKKWRSDTGEDSGKHLMSYAVGGVGISHADVGDLEEYVTWVAASVPEDRKAALLRLTSITYRKKGIVYDEVRAAGRCSGSPADTDLLGEPFRHFIGPAGSDYCNRYQNGMLAEEDWRVFRTWMRASLRTREAQAYLLGLWFRDYWQPTIAQVPGGEGAPEEMLVNARIRNSAPAVARAAVDRPLPLPGTAGRVQREIDAYADWKLKTARRRWKIMMRPVVLYRHFSGQPQLAGVSCK